MNILSNLKRKFNKKNNNNFKKNVKMLNAVIKFYFCGKFSQYFKRINNENTTFKLSFLNIYTILYNSIVDLNKIRGIIAISYLIRKFFMPVFYRSLLRI